MKAYLFPGQGSQFPGMGKDLFLGDNLRGVFQRGADILFRQFRISLDDAFRRVAASDHAEDVLHHDARAADNRLARANLRIDDDTVIHAEKISV